jgi:L-asparaginase/Glu-tRNA(Gln) amidotransferase subunit D
MALRIAVLMTGGTIGHRSRPQGGAVMDFDPTRLCSEIGIPDVELTFRELFRKGSMDIVPRDWVTTAAGVHEALRDGAAGVVILHGTDTMQYTAAALSFMLEGLGSPVILTGSMRPGGGCGQRCAAQPARRRAGGGAGRSGRGLHRIFG